MTERKPPGVSFETWIDKQIREASERGDFASLPGAGKPLHGLDEPYDEQWWLKRKMREEGGSALPPTLRLRKEAEDAREAALAAPSETAARRIIADINDAITTAMRTPMSGPPLNLTPLDEEAVIAEWRAHHPA